MDKSIGTCSHTTKKLEDTKEHNAEHMKTAVDQDVVYGHSPSNGYGIFGFFIRRRMYPPLLVEEPTFNVSYTRQTPGPPPGPQQPGMPYYSDPGGNPAPPSFHMQPNSPQGNPAFPPPPSYYNTPPPPYEQVVKSCK
ncbi:unnamed protein product [Ranitomeya imitator]|uniref:WW domain binding protein VOPP1 n=1 Tax=Ranitomeya imitator TaxID=111125 RepID=A0ABN9KNR6_9NEOB|nr:unnamed protein product [Ranitomeya imitator]